jgi:hypothetical protein
MDELFNILGDSDFTSRYSVDHIHFCRMVCSSPLQPSCDRLQLWTQILIFSDRFRFAEPITHHINAKLATSGQESDGIDNQVACDHDVHTKNTTSDGAGSTNNLNSVPAPHDHDSVTAYSFSVSQITQGKLSTEYSVAHTPIVNGAHDCPLDVPNEPNKSTQPCPMQFPGMHPPHERMCRAGENTCSVLPQFPDMADLDRFLRVIHAPRPSTSDHS